MAATASAAPSSRAPPGGARKSGCSQSGEHCPPCAAHASAASGRANSPRGMRIPVPAPKTCAGSGCGCARPRPAASMTPQVSCRSRASTPRRRRNSTDQRPTASCRWRSRISCWASRRRISASAALPSSRSACRAARSPKMASRRAGPGMAMASTPVAACRRLASEGLPFGIAGLLPAAARFGQPGRCGARRQGAGLRLDGRGQGPGHCGPWLRGGLHLRLRHRIAAQLEDAHGRGQLRGLLLQGIGRRGALLD